MKTIILCLAIVVTTLAACNSDGNKTQDEMQTEKQTDSLSSVNEPKASDQVASKPINTFPENEIVAEYLKLKNALANDNGKDAATAGNALVSVLAKVDTLSLTGSQQKLYADLKDDLKENAEHIGANADKIDHQREHFEMLSKDIADLVKTFGNGGQTLYKDFCPMANDGKGASWISEVKEIKNPYMGKKMATCGSVKETYQ